MKFSEMKYVRPDMEALRQAAAQAVYAIANAADADEAAEAYLSWDKAGGSYATMNSLCYIRHTINTEDKFYDEENEFFDNAGPDFTELNQSVAKAVAESSFRSELEKKFGRVLFINTDIFLKSFSPEIIPEMQADNKLSTEYEKLIASAQIDFDGKKLTLSQLTPYKQSPDDKVRHSAWAAESAFYKEHEHELDRIYDDMVKVRQTMAEKLGYENYVKLGYLNMCRNCYTAEDVAKFREAVVKYIVPVADRLRREQAERIGVAYPMKYADTAVFYRDGNAVPQGTPEDILEAGGDDFSFEDGCVEITTDPKTVGEVAKALTDMGYKVVSAEAEQVPSTYTVLTDEDHIKKMGLLLDMLEDNDDVQNVWHNWEMNE